LGLVPREIYRKIIEKQRKERIQQIQLFLRQIPLMRHWSNRELANLIDRFRPTTVVRAGTTVFREGELAGKVVVVKEGQFELFKTRLDRVYLNQTSGTIKAVMSDGAHITSEAQAKTKNCVTQEDIKKYVGSKLQIEVAQIMSRHVKE
jgi:CRP-like cAMP-binding protein